MVKKNEGTLRTVMGDEHFEDMLVALDAFDRVFKLDKLTVSDHFLFIGGFSFTILRFYSILIPVISRINTVLL